MPNPQTPPRRDEVEEARAYLASQIEPLFVGGRPALAKGIDTLLTALSAAEGDVKRLDFLTSHSEELRSVHDLTGVRPTEAHRHPFTLRGAIDECMRQVAVEAEEDAACTASLATQGRGE